MRSIYTIYGVVMVVGVCYSITEARENRREYYDWRDEQPARYRSESSSYTGYSSGRSSQAKEISHQKSKYSDPCSGDNLPCFDYQLIFVFDGPDCVFEFGNKETINDYYSKAGLDALDVGRDAIRFFWNQYGVNFNYLTDDEILKSPSVTNSHYDIEFTNVNVKDECNFRLTMASAGGKAQVFNQRAFEPYYVVKFNKPFYSRGSFRERIPAGSLGVYGYFLVQTCPDPKDYTNRACKENILTDKPTEFIRLQFQTATYIPTGQSPGNFSAVDYNGYSDLYGRGNLRTLLYQRRDSPGNMDAGIVINFPPNTH